MQILADSCLAFLASVGIWALARMAFHWMMPDWEQHGARIVPCPAEDRVGRERDGEETEEWTKREKTIR